MYLLHAWRRHDQNITALSLALSKRDVFLWASLQVRSHHGVEMKRRSWPDLALRAKIVKNWPGKKQGWSQPASPPPGTSNVVDAIIALVKKAALETAGTEGEMTEDEYVAHLKDCVT